jgi:hypothetical protein
VGGTARPGFRRATHPATLSDGVAFDSRRLDNGPIPGPGNVVWIKGIRVRTELRLGSMLGGDEAVADGAGRSPERSSSINRGRRRPDHAEPTTPRDVDPQMGIARHGLTGSAISISRKSQAGA